jgi:hypothetical protein
VLIGFDLIIYATRMLLSITPGIRKPFGEKVKLAAKPDRRQSQDQVL